MFSAMRSPTIVLVAVCLVMTYNYLQTGFEGSLLAGVGPLSFAYKTVVVTRHALRRCRLACAGFCLVYCRTAASLPTPHHRHATPASRSDSPELAVYRGAFSPR